MKKLLLSFGLLASMAAWSNAETFTLQVADATDIVGEKSEEKRKDDGSLQEAAKYQPLTSFVIGTFKFSPLKAGGTTEPALYLPPSDKPTDPTTFRLYKNNTITIESLDGESITSVKYILKGKTDENNMSAEWTNTTGSNLQMVTFVITTGEGGDTPGPEPITEVVYENDFQSSLGAFTVENKIENNYTGWKMNSNPKCAIANSYVSGQNLEAESWLISPVVDLANREDSNVTFSQGFGFSFPTAEEEYYDFYIREEGGEWVSLGIPEYPEAPASGNWTKTWAVNEYEIGSYDGKKVQFAFVYKNDGSKSRAWEVKDFSVKGTYKESAVSEIAVENEEAVYYNLQGVKTSNPESGLYIRVANGKATKVIF